MRSFELAENEKENDSRGGQATQAIIQRRRRPKRRSTGVCNVGAEVITHQISINFCPFLSSNASSN